MAASITGVCFGAISFNCPLARTIRFGSALPTKSWHRDATRRIMELSDMIDWQSERRSRDGGEEKWQKQ
jgi:hypothetical protein